MAKRGDQARESVKDTIIKAFSESGDFVAFQDKKIYVQAKDGNDGEIIQFAITMTMPKTPVETNTAGVEIGSSTDQVQNSAPSTFATELDPADRQKVEELKKKLGIED